MHRSCRAEIPVKDILSNLADLALVGMILFLWALSCQPHSVHKPLYPLMIDLVAALYQFLIYSSHTVHIWRRMIWKFDACGFDFQSVQLSGIQPELYSVYQAAKAISTGSRNITLANLASPELVTDEAFHLIVCALLLAKYGDAILNFERR